MKKKQLLPLISVALILLFKKLLIMVKVRGKTSLNETFSEEGCSKSRNIFIVQRSFS